MSDVKHEETYYDILKVSANATVAEIVNAYHAAKNAFARDSVATYSLFSPEETKAILDRIEQAYLHLSNIEKRREYDKYLSEKQKGNDVTFTPIQPEPSPVPTPAGDNRADTASSHLGELSLYTGAALKQIREKRSLTLEDVSRITKIPTKFLKAIEGDDLKGMPARVYLQGFVKNLATLYKLDPGGVSKAYLEHIDAKSRAQ